MSDDGFVVSDKTRRGIFTGLMAGERNLPRLMKKRRLLRPAVERAVSELEAHDLVKRDGSTLTLTEKGEEVSRDLKKQDALR